MLPRLLAIVLCVLPAAAVAQLAEGDRHWDARAESLDGRLATPEPTERAIEAYGRAADTGPEALEARWKLLRAVHYLADFTSASDARKEGALKEAAHVSDIWIDELPDEVERPTDRAQLWFWAAIVWGARAQRVGLFTLVREGIATRMHDDALRAAELDPTIERGGIYRLLSRLHSRLPRVPFVTGWVDHDRAVPYAERALAIAPDDPGNRLILAMAILERAPERRAEALRLLETVSQLTPRAALRAEDLATREQARALLEADRTS